MFLKTLKIENDGELIREISFRKGINLIVDETKTDEKTKSGNNVGKTTVLRLIDFCLAADGKEIYVDPEFNEKDDSSVVKDFLKGNNILITLVLKADLDTFTSTEIVIQRNFLNRDDKIQTINGVGYGDREFEKKLKELIFNSTTNKPKFRQIIAKNIRNTETRLKNTLKVLDAYTTGEEYEALYLFWLGIDLESSDRKQKLRRDQKSEEALQSRFRKDSNPSQITQALLVINRSIKEYEARNLTLNQNPKYEKDLENLNKVKLDLNKLSTRLSRLNLRRDLILESKDSLEADVSDVDTRQIQVLYEKANRFIPNLQKTFEETLHFHNKMIKEKIRYITQELPSLESQIKRIKRDFQGLLYEEERLTGMVFKTDVIEEVKNISKLLNEAYEKKGSLEEFQRLWSNSEKKLDIISKELIKINKELFSKDKLITERVAKLNEFLSVISEKLYGEQFVLSPDKGPKGYELMISTTNISASANLGTGKKRGQMAAFDLAYIEFADKLGIDCLHFILLDQIENIHDNQISNLLTEIVSKINCQYILPVLRDKMPEDIDIKKYEVLTLSQDNKLFKI